MNNSPLPPLSPLAFSTLAVSFALAGFVAITLVPRMAASVVPLILCGAILGSLRAPTVSPRAITLTPFIIGFVALLGWIVLRGPWPAAGREALLDALTLVGYAASLIGSLYIVGRAQPVHSQIERVWFSIGYIVVALLVLGHLATDQWASRLLHDWFPILRSSGTRNLIVDGRVVGLNDSEINRQAILLMLWLWPVWLMIMNAHSERRVWIGRGVIAAALISVAFSRSETAKLAMLAGGVLFALHCWKPRAAIAFAAVGWTVAVFAIVPLSTTLYDHGAHKSDHLFYTARARVVVWNSVAEKVQERAVIGHGILSMREHYYDAGKVPPTARVDADSKLPLDAPHAHNIYLQVWYEFGGIGAMLLGLVGYLALIEIYRMKQRMRGAALAHFGVLAGVLATGYGLWQPWLQAGIAYSFFLLMRAGEPSSET